MHPIEFIRRFLLHVLPSGFIKLRHYGLMAPGNINTKLSTARRLLEAAGAVTAAPASESAPEKALTAKPEKPADWRALLLRLTGLDVTRCPVCGNPLHARPLTRALPRSPKDDTS